MYGPDEHYIDPRNPANWKDPELRYEIRSNGKYIDDVQDEDFGRSCILNEPNYWGPELDLYSIDMETGDSEVVMVAEWDEDIQRYLED